MWSLSERFGVGVVDRSIDIKNGKNLSPGALHTGVGGSPMLLVGTPYGERVKEKRVVRGMEKCMLYTHIVWEPNIPPAMHHTKFIPLTITEKEIDYTCMNVWQKKSFSMHA
ncbi:hypothetical protein ACJX0J_037760 [Zea mays]